MGLASQIFLFLATFQRKAKRGAALAGDALHEELHKIFREVDQTAEREAGLSEPWTIARRALVYLVDEVMTTTEWEYRGWWDDNALETRLLNSPHKMRGILFFDDLDKAKSQFKQAQAAQNQTDPCLVDLLTVFYCCLRFGFEGKFAGQPEALDREAQQIRSMLPLSSRRQTRTFFEEAYAHTVEVSPRYRTVMRLAAMVAVVVGVIIAFFGFRAVLWNELLDDLTTAAQEAGSFFSSQSAGDS